jgi:hypothetical protein
MKSGFAPKVSLLARKLQRKYTAQRVGNSWVAQTKLLKSWLVAWGRLVNFPFGGGKILSMI